jgi:hypothetical protein
MMNDLLSNKVFLQIQHQGIPCNGLIQVDDPKFYYEVFSRLKSHIGYSIKDIGDLDLSHAL